MAQEQDIVVMRGGLDLVTPALQVPPGFLISCQNYEAEARGYRRVQGYERYDGQPKPSLASYYILNFDAGTAAISADDTVTGATSGATAKALVDAVVESGSYGGNDAAGYLVLYNVSGTFQDDENLQVSAATKCVADGTTTENGADNDTDDSTWTQAAIEARRTDIAAVPGSGPVRGVATYKGDVYAWRNNAGGTAGTMWKATTAGWVQQTFGHTLDFDAGTAAFTAGETLTGGTSGATATIERVVKMSGSWGSTAAGYLVLSGITGTFQNNETITDGASGSATADGTQAAITLPAGGTYRHVVANFYAASNLTRLYFVNGEGYAHEWDGTVLAPIRTGVTTSLDKPKFITEHALHLFVAYAGGSLQHSGTGLPLSWNVDDGAGEIGIGRDITGLLADVRGAVIIATRNSMHYLTGRSDNDFAVEDIADDSGAITDTLAQVGVPHFLDDIGVRSLETAQEFGNWQLGTQTRLVEPLLKPKITSSTINVVGALRVRAKDQYRLFFDDKSGLNIYFGREKPECMPFLLQFTPSCVHSGEDSAGNEILLVGGTDGYVYEVDAGTSQDGAEVEAYFRTGFLNQKSPNRDKRYHQVIAEIEAGGGGNAIAISADFAYGDPDQPSAAETSASTFGGGGFWDTAYWDQFYWSSVVQGRAKAPLHGIGQNISVVIMSDATYEPEHTVSALTVFYKPRRQLR